MKFLGMALLAFALSGCAGADALVGSSTMDVKRIERVIERGVKNQAGLDSTVECPSSIELEVGRTFSCLVRSGGERAFARVTIQNDVGDIVWEIK